VQWLVTKVRNARRDARIWLELRRETASKPTRSSTTPPGFSAFLWLVMFFGCGPAVLILALTHQLNGRGIVASLIVCYVALALVFAYSSRKSRPRK
jgi:hypothetical protein